MLFKCRQTHTRLSATHKQIHTEPVLVFDSVLLARKWLNTERPRQIKQKQKQQQQSLSERSVDHVTSKSVNRIHIFLLLCVLVPFFPNTSSYFKCFKDVDYIPTPAFIFKCYFHHKLRSSGSTILNVPTCMTKWFKIKQENIVKIRRVTLKCAQILNVSNFVKLKNLFLCKIILSKRCIENGFIIIRMEFWIIFIWLLLVCTNSKWSETHAHRPSNSELNSITRRKKTTEQKKSCRFKSTEQTQFIAYTWSKRKIIKNFKIIKLVMESMKI